jgi:hypothetical protein
MSETVFWIVLAGVFLTLAVVAGIEREKVRSKELLMPGVLPFIPTAVADPLKTMLVVELVGFLAAAAAAIVTAFF